MEKAKHYPNPSLSFLYFTNCLKTHVPYVDSTFVPISKKNLPSWFWLSRFVFVMKMIKILLFGLTLRNFNSAIFFFGSINMLLLVLRLLEFKTRKKSQNTRKLWLTNKNSTLNKTISEFNRSETYWWYLSQYPSLLVEGMFKRSYVHMIWHDRRAYLFTLIVEPLYGGYF